MPRTIIQMDEVSLCYRLAKQKVGSIKEYFIHLIKGNLTYEDLWALEEISLNIQAGELVGILGPNGAGKSTLAKVIAGVLEPSKGKRQVNGSISPILELGTGFDYELTGWENIYLNALLLGHRKKEITPKIDGIIAFSGLGDFIDAPVRNYSSGMLARLGFAIATAWIPDVLILDEVLAVGDARFRARCEARIKQFQEQGTTILLISHSTEELLQHSGRCLWIKKGRLQADGDPQEIVGAYLEEMAAEVAAIESELDPEPSPVAMIGA
jgi:ABC-2 type transport system ATP-binding protein/lipopolysaccharide transport system ATP-binding protein